MSAIHGVAESLRSQLSTHKTRSSQLDPFALFGSCNMRPVKRILVRCRTTNEINHFLVSNRILSLENQFEILKTAGRCGFSQSLEKQLGVEGAKHVAEVLPKW